MSRAALVVGVVLAIGCRAEPPQQPSVSESEVRAAVAGYLERLETQPVDVDSLAAWYDPAAEVLEPGVGALRGIGRVRHYLESYRDIVVEKAEFGIDTVEVYGGRTAYVWGFFTQRMRQRDSTVTESRARALYVWGRDPDGRWRIVRSLTQPVGG
ncbi:MAG: YybH family protein [Gemmatimonadales bacterium]